MEDYIFSSPSENSDRGQGGVDDRGQMIGEEQSTNAFDDSAEMKINQRQSFGQVRGTSFGLSAKGDSGSRRSRGQDAHQMLIDDTTVTLRNSFRQEERTRRVPTDVEEKNDRGVQSAHVPERRGDFKISSDAAVDLCGAFINSLGLGEKTNTLFTVVNIMRGMNDDEIARLHNMTVGTEDIRGTAASKGR